MLPEPHNRIIATGNAVVFGWLLPQHAMQQLEQDPELSSLPDEALQIFLDETDRYWREHLDAAIAHPENVAIYPALMAVCAETRLKAIGQYRRGAGRERQAEFEARMGRWITTTARCLIARGMALLLLPQPQAAWETFTRANWMARALPDSGRLRLGEVLEACYGQHVAAMLGNQPQLAAQARAELTGLTQRAGREQEAQQYLQEVADQFHRLLEILHRRATAQQEEPPAAAASAGVPRDTADAGLSYIERLNAFGGLVHDGKLTVDQAAVQLVEVLGPGAVPAQTIYFVSLLTRRLAETAPERAIVLAGLNSAVAQTLAGDLAQLTRAYCAYTLARALALQARRTGKASIYRQAIAYYHEALPVLDAGEHEGKQIAADIVAELVLCYRGTGDLARAQKLSYEAIWRLEALPARRSNLGVAYGNLADVQEQLGDVAAAYANHYRALELFIETGDVPHLRQAVRYLTRLCCQAGRLDDAVVAAQEAAELMQRLAQLQDAVETHMLLASLLFRIRRFADALAMLQQAEDALLPMLSTEQADRYTVQMYSDLLIWRGALHTLLLGDPSGAFTVERAYAPLEEGRRIAAELGDYDRLAAALLQLAMLFSQAGELDAAEEYCGMVEQVPCSDLYRTRYHDMLGATLLKRGRLEEAQEHLQQAIAGYGPDMADRRFAALYSLGMVHEAAQDHTRAVARYEQALETFEQSRLELYEASRTAVMANAADVYEQLILAYARPGSPVADPTRALHWLERSKSRTFIETLGLSALPLPDVPVPARADLAEERRLLHELNALRQAIFLTAEASPDRLAAHQAMFACLEQLQQLWARLSETLPEYVELRRGNVTGWDELRRLLAG